ncbi:MAG: DUF4136 domain-containing protein [Candidatus Cyclobacteriaceae bacterium M3_2C_046]
MKIFFKLIFFIFIIASCQRKAFFSDVQNAADFDSFETFAFLPNIDTSVYNAEIVQYRGEIEVKEHLETKGLKLDTINPDLLVRVHTMFENLQENTNRPPNSVRNKYMIYYRGAFPPPDVAEQEYPALEYTYGSMMVDVHNAGNNQLVWRGWSNRMIQPTALPEEFEVYFDRLMAPFPEVDDK